MSIINNKVLLLKSSKSISLWEINRSACRICRRSIYSLFVSILRIDRFIYLAAISDCTASQVKSSYRWLSAMTLCDHREMKWIFLYLFYAHSFVVEKEKNRINSEKIPPQQDVEAKSCINVMCPLGGITQKYENRIFGIMYLFMSNMQY